MVLLSVELDGRNCTVSCVNVLQECVFDPDSDGEIDQVCSLSAVSLYLIWACIAVLAALASSVGKWFYAKFFVPTQLEQIEVLNKHFKKKLVEAQNNNLQLRFQENSVKLIFQLFNVVQFLTILFYTEIIFDIMNSLVTVTISLFLTPTISFIINYFRPDVETLSAFLRRNLEVDDVSDEDLFETAYLIEIDKKNKVATDVWFPWKRGFLFYMFLASLFALFWPLAMFELNKDFLPATTNEIVFYVSTVQACFLNIMIVLYWYIGRQGMAIFKTVNGQLSLTYSYGSLANYFAMSGHTVTIYIDPTDLAQSRQRYDSQGAELMEVGDAGRQTITEADELGEAYQMSPVAKAYESTADEEEMRRMQKENNKKGGAISPRIKGKPGDLSRSLKNL